MAITELLNVGAENARTGKELASILGCDLRDITATIERERRKGKPICAGSGENPGYYLAADAEELEQYCGRLKHRAKELYKTLGALQNSLNNV
jgi:hypothetical protein